MENSSQQNTHGYRIKSKTTFNKINSEYVKILRRTNRNDRSNASRESELCMCECVCKQRHFQNCIFIEWFFLCCFFCISCLAMIWFACCCCYSSRTFVVEPNKNIVLKCAWLTKRNEAVVSLSSSICFIYFVLLMLFVACHNIITIFVCVLITIFLSLFSFILIAACFFTGYSNNKRMIVVSQWKTYFTVEYA